MSRLFSNIFLAINILFVLALLVSAWGGMVNPGFCGWFVSATLFFPILLLVNVLFAVVWLVVLSRRWLWSVLAIVACWGNLRNYCPVNITEPIPKGSVKVVSYNVYGYSGFPTDSIKYGMMLDYLKNSDADIFCAQEAYYSPGRSREIEKALSHWAYRDTLVFENAVNALMLCSNYPILERRVVRAPSVCHACAVYKLKIKSDTVVVVNCHFVSNGINGEDKQTYHDIITSPEEIDTKEGLLRLCRKVNAAGVKRAEQADSLVAYLEELGDVPIIVCGDFNDSPLSYVNHRLSRKLNDAYVKSGNGPGISYHVAGMFFRLDNVFCSHHWRSFGAKVDSQQEMSDHYPLEVFLRRVE